MATPILHAVTGRDGAMLRPGAWIGHVCALHDFVCSLVGWCVMKVHIGGCRIQVEQATQVSAGRTHMELCV